MRDEVFGKPQRFIEQFSFNDTVADVFADMISRSVPGYDLTLEMLSVISARYSQNDTYCYDLGSSLGASSLSLAKGAVENCQVIGLDNSQAMLTRATALLQDSPYQNICYELADIRHYAFQPASVVSSNFTLQFVPPADRFTLVSDIYNTLVPGGVFVLSEKVDFEQAQHGETHINLYHDFKRGRGYSDLEVAQKRSALEDVLVPETLQQHCERLRSVGFADVMPWFQCFNFCSMIAYK